jgi:peptidyl-prolyl cis-trans isomerase C
MVVADLVATVSVFRRIVRDRLFHFAVGGAVIFAIAPASEKSNRVSLSGAYLASLHAAQAHRLGVPSLSESGTSEIDRRAVEDEVLYREAVRLGLDRDDALVREHLIQKMLLLAEDVGGASHEATDEELRAYYGRTQERWRLEERVHLVHVFATRREGAAALAAAVRVAAHVAEPPPLGEAFARSRDARGSRADFEATYGEPFAGAVFDLSPGVWSDAIESKFGWHLVKVLAHDPGAVAPFDSVVDRVRLDYAVERRHAAIARFIEQSFKRYDVDIDGTRVGRYDATPRLAFRSSPSQED